MQSANKFLLWAFLISIQNNYQKTYKENTTNQIMEKDLGKIKKNNETEIIIRIDDFGGKPGLTIREFVNSDKYKGFTKSGTRIPAESFENFKKIINSISTKDFSEKTTQNPTEDDIGIDEKGLI